MKDYGMSNEKFELNSESNFTITYEVSSDVDVPFVGPTLEVTHSINDHILLYSKVYSDTKSLRELGQFLIDKADEFDKVPSNMRTEYPYKAISSNSNYGGNDD